MNNKKWNKGAPPYIGWWNASAHRSEIIWRWWDGKCWSQNAYFRLNSMQAEKCAKRKSKISDRFIEWTSYWPENAQVPRINPNKPKGK